MCIHKDAVCIFFRATEFERSWLLRLSADVQHVVSGGFVGWWGALGWHAMRIIRRATKAPMVCS
jgi:hypothetical protein